MAVRELICIGCPLGCNLEVEIEDKEVSQLREILALEEKYMQRKNVQILQES